jgi:DNA polymerase-3 subunit beta
VKLRVDRNALADAVAWVTRTVNTSRATLPALSGVLLEAADGRLTCRATDLDVAAEVTLPVAAEIEGSALLPGRLFSQIVAKFPDAAVDLDATGDRVEVRCGRATFRVRSMPVEDFPALPQVDPDATRGEIKSDAFNRLVTQVARAASSDVARPVLTGVHLAAEDGVLTAAATDSYRLAVREFPWDVGTSASALVPARALSEAAKAGHEVGGSVTIVFEDDKASFLLGDRRLTTQLIDGTFPSFRKLLPDGYETAVVVDRPALVDALQRVAVVALGQANTPVSLTFEDGTVDLAAGNRELGDAAEALPAEIEGPGLTIAFNPTYLLSGLDATGTERIRIELRDGLKPAVLRPQADGDEVVDDLTYLLMPMRVS